MRCTEERAGTAPTLSAEVAAVAATSPLFSEMSPGDIRRALIRFDEESFNAGHRIALEGLRGSDVFIVVSGSAQVSVDGRRIATLRPGDFFGELGVLGDGLRFASVTAETPLRCLVLPNRGLEPLILDHPQIGLNLLREVVSRFQDLAVRRWSSVTEPA